MASASIFEDLREFSWRGIGFPAATTRLAIKHSHAVHKWADRDGAHVEATGRDPLEFDVTIPMRNGIAPGPNETWTGPLYPVVFKALLGALLDRSSDTLNHPELGNITCKVASADVRWDPNKRDGVDIDVRFIESTDTPDDLNQTIAAASPISSASQYASDLDAQIKFVPSFPQTPPNVLSFADSMRSLQAITDQAALVSAKVQGQINAIVYRVVAVENSAVALKSATYWPIINSCERIKSALNDLRKTLLVASKTIRFYVTPSVLTLSQIAIATGSKIADLISLNPALVANATISARTLVRYYG